MKKSVQKRKSLTQETEYASEEEEIVDSSNVLLHQLCKQLHPVKHLEASLPPLLQQPHQALSSFLGHAFSSFSNDSVMIVGPGKSGKKHLVKYTLKELKKSRKYSFKSIYINGQNVSTDAHLLGYVLSELDRVKNSEEEEVIVNENHYQNDDDFDEQAKSVEFLQSLKDFTNQSIVFILDNFENLCKNAGKMLYTITDTCHESRLSVILIGITTSSSIALAMDRRVRSRFSSRKIYTLLPRNVSQVSQVLSYYLQVHSDLNDNSIELYNNQLLTCLLDPDVVQLLEEVKLRSNCTFIYDLAFKIFELCQPALEKYPIPEDATIITPAMINKAFLSLVNNRVDSR